MFIIMIEPLYVINVLGWPLYRAPYIESMCIVAWMATIIEGLQPPV